MEKSHIFLIVFAIFIAFSSCEKDNETTIFYWNETGCSNPWEQDNNDTEEEKKAKIENYLSDQNVSIENIEFEFDSTKEQFCRACHCTTGSIIVMKVSTKDKRKMKRLDFYQ